MNENNKKMRRRLKVLVVVRWPVGGIRTFIRYSYRTFDPDRYEFRLIGPDVAEFRLLQKDLNKLKCEYEYLEKNPSPWNLTRAIWRNIRQRDYDLIHSHGLTSGVCAVIPALLFRTPHLVSLHEVLNDEQFDGIGGGFKRIGLSGVFPLFKTIHCVSHDAKTNLLESIPSLRVCKAKVVTIPNGIDTKQFLLADKCDLRRELGLSTGVFLIGFLGRFMPAKGFTYLLEALEIIVKRGDKLKTKKPIVLTFGKGDGFYREEMGVITKKGLRDHINFLDFRPEIGSTLKGLDLVVIPSLWEAGPLVPMEALVAGVPLIGTDCIGLKEVLKNTPAVVVPVKDAGALANAIIKEMKNPSKAKFEAFAPEAAERFDVERQAKELEKVILNLVEQRMR